MMWVSRVTRSELKPGLAWNARPRHLDTQVWCQPNQILAYFDDRNRCCGQPQQRCQLGPKQFIDQNAAVLGVILELPDVIVSVGTAHEMRLGTSAHSSDFLDPVQHLRCREGI